MSYFKIIEPEATTNLILDPQAGAADPDTSWTINGDGSAPDVVRYTGDQWIGTGCFQFDIDDGSYTRLIQAITATAVSYTLSARIKRAAAGVVSSTEAQAHFDSADGSWDSVSADRDGWYLCVKSGTATAGTRNFGVRANEDGLLVDAVQLEQKAYRTTYADGTLKGHRSDGYRWSGAAHASASVRHSQERSGGRVRDIEDDLGVNSVNSFIGGGEAPEEHHNEELALLPGALYQDSKKQVRFIDLGLTFKSSDGTPQGLHSNRKLLAHATRTTRVTPKQPFVFRYTGGPQTMEIDALRVSGLDQGSLNKLIERTTMRMKCDQPDWRGLGETASELSLPASLADADYIVQRSADGVWSAMDGLNGEVRAIVVGPDGAVYVGGGFTNAGGVANADYIAKWDGASWSALGTGTNAIVYDLAFGPDGTLYVAGGFTSAGGVANTAYIAKWNGSAWSALGTGANSTSVLSLVFGLDGTLYAAGGFTQMGGVANTAYIAKWNGSAWSALGTGMNGNVRGVAVGLDGTLYATGAFTTAGGTSASRIAKWNGSTWSALGTGISGAGWSIAIGNDGAIYVGGQFTSAGGVSGTAYVAKWDGASWSPLGTGMDDSVRTVTVGIDGNLYAGGNFTEASGIALLDRVAVWNGSTWFPFSNIDLPGSPIVYAVNASTDTLYLGFDTAGTATVADTDTITYGGSANSWPRLIVTGPCTLYRLANLTTGKSIYFDLTLLAGETATLDLAPDQITFGSTFRPQLIQTILNGSDVATWFLQPGENVISLFMTGTDTPTEAFLVWPEMFEGADG